MKTGKMQKVEWLGMGMEFPEEWEITRHSVSREKGRLVIVDRRRQRMLVTWAHVEKKPDLKRAVSDYRSRDLAEDGQTQFEPLSATGRWRGFRRVRGKAALTRAGTYHDGMKRWVEVTLTWPEGVDAKLERAILEGFEIAKDEDGPVRVKAFGVDVETPAGWAIEKVEVKPAAVTLALKRGHTTLTVRRLGMVESWFKGDMAAFLREEFGKGKVETASATDCNGHAGQRAEGREEASRLKRLLAMAKKRTDVAWVCPGAHSLFQVSVSGAREETADPREAKVRCCGKSGEIGR